MALIACDVVTIIDTIAYIGGHAAPAKEEILLQLNDVLVELQAASPERAEVVKLRFFVGLSEPEIAEILRISERSVQRQWSYARAWLFQRIETM